MRSSWAATTVTTMRSRLVLLRQPNVRILQRSFAQTAIARTGLRARPQLPFLSVPTSRAGRVRHMTTERKAQLKYEILQGIKYTGYIWIAGACAIAIWGAIYLESTERKYPTPEDWSFMTRLRFRGGHVARHEPVEGRSTDWIQVGHWIDTTIKRLHDPNIDGAGLKDAPPDCPPGTKDITAKSENWRRGYYEAMMFWAKAAEHMEGWVWDRKRKCTFPPGTMVGPSNPFPKPLPPGFHGAPREEDCELRHDSPNDIYLRILNTVGFTTRQKIEAGLAYASWLEYKGTHGPASIILEDTLSLAASELPSPPLDEKTFTLQNDSPSSTPPSENLLNALTAYATFRARQGDITNALPILVSILQARRALPPPSFDISSSRKGRDQSKGILASTKSFFKFITTPPAYPPPPPDGTAPPVRNPAELCQEAALSLHIGEIMYATSKTAREEGLGWTREAVDVAEEQLHRLNPNLREEKAPREQCRQCLITGLDNWTKMVARLAKEEEARRAERLDSPGGASSTGWFSGLWGPAGGTTEIKAEDTNRWAAEAKVIDERRNRVSDLVEDLRKPSRGFLTWIKV
ncbi:hypothetical protein QBC35DRAFT_128813 [Podospora australis]|uniref:MFS maltose permease n=1 Tax=Podospora australis TaxID=1536484 RepID=A0AAN7AKT8_9PEZI|nr:hypothetical protein QBC35DRAFT_128813 [Podospora australis]